MHRLSGVSIQTCPSCLITSLLSEQEWAGGGGLGEQGGACEGSWEGMGLQDGCVGEQQWCQCTHAGP